MASLFLPVIPSAPWALRRDSNGSTHKSPYRVIYLAKQPRANRYDYTNPGGHSTRPRRWTCYSSRVSYSHTRQVWTKITDAVAQIPASSRLSHPVCGAPYCFCHLPFRQSIRQSYGDHPRRWQEDWILCWCYCKPSLLHSGCTLTMTCLSFSYTARIRNQFSLPQRLSRPFSGGGYLTALGEEWF